MKIKKYPLIIRGSLVQAQVGPLHYQEVSRILQLASFYLHSICTEKFPLFYYYFSDFLSVDKQIRSSLTPV